ncbi:MAG: hypothetical protein SGILL_007457 [Bacillariaceae sp.]
MKKSKELSFCVSNKPASIKTLEGTIADADIVTEFEEEVMAAHEDGKSTPDADEDAEQHKLIGRICKKLEGKYPGKVETYNDLTKKFKVRYIDPDYPTGRPKRQLNVDKSKLLEMLWYADE